MQATASPPHSPEPEPPLEAVSPREIGSVAGEPAAAEQVPGGRPDTRWVWQVTALSLVLGVMLALAMTTSNKIRNAGTIGPRFGVSGALLTAYATKSESLEKQVNELRARVRQFEASVDKDSQALKVLQNELNRLKIMSGMTVVEGPGLKITLRDSQVARLPSESPLEGEAYSVHDQDINGVLNELKAAGAEAVAISGADEKNLQRVAVLTSARCVGPVAIVNGVSLAAPYHIFAIGNPKELRAALEMPGGYVEARALKVLNMYSIEESEKLVLPEYSGSFTPQYARQAPKSE